MSVLEIRLGEKSMKLNPKKVEYLSADKWFKFLGFSIKGSLISLSSGRIKTFQKEIEKRTIRKPGISLAKAINSVNRYLYRVMASSVGLHKFYLFVMSNMTLTN